MNFLVTGGAGFIGSHLVKKLLTSGHKVAVLDDFSNSEKNQVPSEVNLIEGSVSSEEKLSEALKNCDGVFHLAAEVSVPASMENPTKTLETNALGTLKLLKQMKLQNVPKIVYASTSAIYGDRDQELNKEDMKPRPLSPYAYTKLQGEYFIKTWAHLHSLEFSILRFFNVYGPGQSPNSPYAAVIPKFFSQAQENQPLKIFGDGSATRDFIFVEDVVEIALKAMLKPTSKVFKCGHGRVHSNKNTSGKNH